jgi:hypothetical protein
MKNKASDAPCLDEKADLKSLDWSVGSWQVVEPGCFLVEGRCLLYKPD